MRRGDSFDKYSLNLVTQSHDGVHLFNFILIMKFIKKGLIYSLDKKNWWMDNSTLTPTPFLLNDQTIRIYCAIRDVKGSARIGYVDVDAQNPSKILKVSDEPVLDIGEDGMFDDNGVILGDVIRDGDEVRMYYVGFQLVNKVKFLAYSGLAISSDNGETFQRFSKTPIMDRADNALFIRAIHGTTKAKDHWRIWYSASSKWEEIDGQVFPFYNVRYAESKDGIHFSDNVGSLCLDNSGDEYRIGRARFIKIKNEDFLFYTYGTKDKINHAGVAKSHDGKNWKREKNFYFDRSENDFDSKDLGYPAPLIYKNKIYIFYTGNGCGVSGFGYAEAEL